MKPETLFLTEHPFTGVFLLKASDGKFVSSFPTIDAAKKFCEASAYSLRITTKRVTEWFTPNCPEAHEHLKRTI